ncbi:MAG: tetratricopeptide repeat protein [Myxococcota bacterium]
MNLDDSEDVEIQAPAAPSGEGSRSPRPAPPPPRSPPSRPSDRGVSPPAEPTAAPAEPGGAPGGASFRPPRADLALRAELAREPVAARAARIEDELGRLAVAEADARAHFEGALGHVPDFLPALRGARRLRLAAGDLGAAVAAFDREEALAPDVRSRAVLALERAYALLEHGQEEAGDAAMGAVVDNDPGWMTGLKALGLRAVIGKDYGRQAEVLTREAQGLADDVHHRAAVLVQHARILARRTARPEAAVDAFLTALELDAQTPVALAAVKRMLFAQSRWRELVAAHERTAALTRDPVRQTWSWSTIARLYDERLGSKEDAARALEQAARISEKSPALLEELARRYLELGRRSEAAGALERMAAAVARPADKLSVYLRLGRLFDGPDGDAGAAERWYGVALSVDPAHPPALAALDDLYAARGAHEERVRMLAAAAAAPVSSSRRADAHLRAADICEQRLDRPEAALEHFQHALTMCPTSAAAFDGVVRRLVAAQRYGELVEVYDRAVDRAATEDIAITYLFKIASLHEDVARDLDRAVATYERILARDPQHLGALHALQRVAATAGDVERCIRAHDAEAALLDADAPRRIELEHRAAELTRDIRGDVEEARRRFEDLLRRAPRHVPTMESLARLYHRLERHRDERDILARQLELADDVAGRVALLVAIAALSEDQLADARGAIDMYRRAVAADPEHPVAGRSLRRLLRRTEDYDGLAEVLGEELSRTGSEAQAFELAHELGRINEVDRNRPQEAIDAFRRALEVRPGHGGAAESLQRVLAAEGRWGELDEALIAQAEADPDPQLGLDAKVEAAWLRADRLDRAGDAILLLEEVSGAQPRNVAALLVLEQLYAARGAETALDSVWDRQAEVFLQPGARVAALYHRGRALVAKGGDDAALRRVCAAIMAIDPRHEWALETMAVVAERQADGHLRADMASRRAEIAAEPSMAAWAHQELGDALRGLNPSAALAAYRKASALDPERLLPVRGIFDIGYALGDTDTVIEALRAEAAWRTDDDAAAELLVFASGLQSAQGRWPGAIEDAEAALRRHPDHGGAAAQLESLLRRTGRTDRLVEQLSQAAHAARQPPRRVALWRRVGELYADTVGDLGAALTALGRALEAAPTEGLTLRQLADLHLRARQHDEAAALLTRAVELAPDDVEAHFELARIHVGARPDPTKAQRSLDVVRAARPDDPRVLAMQLTAHLLKGERERARDVGEALLAAAADDLPTKAWALAEIGRAELAAGDTSRAASVLRESVVLEGPKGVGAELYRQLIGSGVGEQDYSDALAAHLQRHPGAAPEVYLDLARRQRRISPVPAEALETLERGLERHPRAEALQLERAGLLLDAGRTGEANGLFRDLARQRPESAGAWRGMVRSLQQLGLPGEASLAAGALVVLGEADDVESNLARERRLQPGDARPGSLGPATLRAISLGQQDDEDRLAELFAVHADGLAKAFPPAYDAYGVRRGDRIKARTPHPVRAVVDRLLPAFGFEDFELFVHAGAGGDVSIELSTPPGVMVPESVADLEEGPLVFLLGRALAGVASGLHPALRLAPETLAAVVAAAVRRASVGFEAGQHDEEEIARLAPLLTPSWFGRGRVDEAVQRYLAAPVDVRQWAPLVRRSVTRVGAILAGDLGACIEGMRAVGEVEGADVVGQSEVVRDLLGFWMSDEAMEVRRLAGVL